MLETKSPAATTVPGERHEVQFYEGTAYLLDTVTEYLSEGLAAGEAAVVIAFAAHREALEQRLARRGIDLKEAAASGRYLSLDAAHTLTLFMNGDLPDPVQFTEVVGGIIGRAASASTVGRVRAFGEMVALLSARGHGAAAVRLEDLWNELVERLDVSLLCGYPLAAFAGEGSEQEFGEVTDRHGRVRPTERYMALEPDERLLEVARLQRHAASATRAVAAGDAFFARVSHELRTPLSAILGFAGLMESRPNALGPREAGYLARIRGAGEDLRRLLDGILELAELDTGRTSLVASEFEVATLLEAPVSAASELCVTAGVAFEAAPLPTGRVRADPRRMSAALIEVVRHLARSGERTGSLRFAASIVADQLHISLVRSGTTITPRAIEGLFEAFPTQFTGGSTQAQPTRIGLAYARRIVELHGGTITAGTDPGGQTTIHIVLPLAGAPGR